MLAELMQPRHLKVPGSESFPDRLVTWTNLSIGNPALGLMVIQERKGPAGEWNTYRYGVREMPLEGGYRFRVASPLSKNEEPYYCFLSADPYRKQFAPESADDLCTCRGFESTGNCKHLICLRQLVRHLYIPGLSLPQLRSLGAAQRREKVTA